MQLGPTHTPSDTVVITAGDIESLSAGFASLWHRSPTTAELDGLIAGRVREYIYYREALKMGLDRNDTTIRSWLQQKLEFLSQDLTPPPQPSEHDLRTFLSKHPEEFRTDARLSFRVIFVDASRHGAATRRDAEAILARLERDPRPEGSSFTRLSQSEVARRLGNEVATALTTAPPQRWSGPVASDDGIYLIYLIEREEGATPAFDDIRPAVEKAWLAAQRQETNEKFYQGLRQRYTVVVERPAEVRAPGTPATEPR